MGKKECYTFSVSFLCTFIFMAILISQVRFLISETDSLPQHYFLHFPNLKPKVQQYTVLSNAWYEGKIIKKITGIAGDKLWFNEKNELFINQLRVGKPFKVTPDGRALTAIQAQIIPKGYVFLSSEHPKSFDSRYQELGLVPLSQLEGLVIPLGSS
jgi:hypothetical protein